MSENSPIDRARLAVERGGLGSRLREPILAVISLVAVAVVAFMAYGRVGGSDTDAVRADNLIPIVETIDDEPEAPEATPVPVASRSRSGEAARFDTVPPTTAAPRPRPASTADPESTTTSETAPAGTGTLPPITTGTTVPPPPTTGTAPTLPSIPEPSVDPEPTIPIETRPVETTRVTTTRVTLTLPPFLTWLTQPPPTTVENTVAP